MSYDFFLDQLSQHCRNGTKNFFIIKNPGFLVPGSRIEKKASLSCDWYDQIYEALRTETNLKEKNPGELLCMIAVLYDS
jgi:hypothetical protein